MTLPIVPKNGVNTKLQRYLNKLLDDVMKDPQATLTDKMKVIDRSLKLDAIRLKVQDSGEGGFFNDPNRKGAEDENE